MHRDVDGHVYRALTIAGSDSGGGAGIQADLKTFSAFSVYGMSVLTAVTAQNTLGVQGVHHVPVDIIQSQLQSVQTDIGADAAKTGMLGSGEIIAAVVQGLKDHPVKHLVVDPVMIAKGGASLLETDAVEALRESLLPLATVVTPNLPEAEALCGHTVHSREDALQAARELYAMSGATVVVKGGHAEDSVLSTDIVYDGVSFTELSSRRVESRKTHGTGCTFSAAITANLARGMGILSSIALAKAFITQAILTAKDWDVGSGHGPTNHSVDVSKLEDALSTGIAFVAGNEYMYEGGAWTLRLANDR